VRTDRLQRDFGVELRWSVFPLHPEVPEEGMDLAELFVGREEQLAAMQARLLQLSIEEGLPLASRNRTCNSRRAQELGKWAESRGKGAPYLMAVYRAYFVDGRNIALVDELVRIAEDAGLPGGEAGEVLATKSFAGEVDDDWRRAMELGISGVPTHLCGGRKLVGFSPYEDFVRLISRN
jgi:predicted DsbA family dithiol-disulfide isomerase